MGLGGIKSRLKREREFREFDRLRNLFGNIIDLNQVICMNAGCYISRHSSISPSKGGNLSGRGIVKGRHNMEWLGAG